MKGARTAPLAQLEAEAATYSSNVGGKAPRPRATKPKWHLTAAQRAEAFLKTLGLWTGEQT